MDFKETKLWKESVANEKYGHIDLRNQLISAFIQSRTNASLILKKIRDDFPNLTVHDITHADGLWQVASVIVGDNYSVNPLEAFVLGCAFLMHDAVLSYDAVGGIQHLRSLKEWKDYYEDYKKVDSLEEDEKLFETDFMAIRLLHAKKAEDLHNQLFDRCDGSRFYLIENEFLRNHYGEIISQIAGSHHWSIEDVDKKLDIQVPPTHEYPIEWRINPLKLACILRCADAGHIDNGRAPDYLLRLLKANGVSRNHWVAQNRLSQIDIDLHDKEKVIIKSNINFKEEDFAAWNVAYDAVHILDHELKKSNELLKKKSIDEFRAKGVSGAGSKEELKKYIKTEDWEPYDAFVHISNVEKLIINLGGQKLYGKEHNLEIVLRELIQNSRDAIVARRYMDVGFRGKILIEIDEKDDGTWISVTDDGVGMSMSTIKDCFLNFGFNFWSSDLSKQEYSGLNSSGFKSVGQFGIGFFSIFMVAKTVIVESRKFDSSLNDNIVLKFLNGLCLSPIVSHKRGVSNTSTIIRFLLDNQKIEWKNKYTVKPAIIGSISFDIPYASIISRITAGIDVDVYYKEPKKDEIRVHLDIKEIREGSNELNEWLKDITYARYRDNNSYLDYIEANYQRLRRIDIDGSFYGIAALNTFWNNQSSYFGISTVGGLSNIGDVNDDSDYIGCLIYETDTARREAKAGNINLSKWANEQLCILKENSLSDVDRLYLPYILVKYRIDITDDMLIYVFDGGNREYSSHNLKELIVNLAGANKKFIIGLSSFTKNSRAESYLDRERSTQQLSKDEMLFVPLMNSEFLCVSQDDTSLHTNLMWCINKICKDLGFKVSSYKENNKTVSRICGTGEALVLTFSKGNQ